MVLVGLCWSTRLRGTTSGYDPGRYEYSSSGFWAFEGSACFLRARSVGTLIRFCELLPPFLLNPKDTKP